MTAMSLLPIEKNTIIYGSNDSGNTVRNDNSQFSHLMFKVDFLLRLLILLGSSVNVFLFKGGGNVELEGACRR